MEAHKCDRCGNYVDGGDMPLIIGWGSEGAKMIGSPLINMDLCPECFDALKEFLHKGDEENE